jgi:hypothetical protein
MYLREAKVGEWEGGRGCNLPSGGCRSENLRKSSMHLVGYKFDSPMGVGDKNLSSLTL